MRVTEAAAVGVFPLIGRGDERAADQAAVEAMRPAFNRLPIDGTVVIGEGERDEAPMLFIGEKVGAGGMKVDIALDPLEGTTLTAKALPNALAVMAMAEAGTLLNAPDTYMDKIAIGPGYREDTIDLDADPADNIVSLAKAKGVKPTAIRALILDRPRHEKLIASVRKTGAAVELITDGDIAGVIATTDPGHTGIDIYLGQGAPEGVLAAAALRCVGGQLQTRLIFRKDDERARRKTRHPRFQPQIPAERSGKGRLPVRGDRRDQRHHARRRARRGRDDHHAFHRHAVRHQDRALDQDETPPRRCRLTPL